MTPPEPMDARAVTERLFAAADRSTEPVIANCEGVGAFDVVGVVSTPRGPVMQLRLQTPARPEIDGLAPVDDDHPVKVYLSEH